MINVLDQKVEARPQSSGEEKSFGVIPEGDYNVTVLEVKEWRPTKKDIWVNQRDESGKIKRDADGKIMKELHKDMTFYNLDITLEITDGEHKGRRIWTSLTTHPNAEFITQGFLYAIGASQMTYGEIPESVVGKSLAVKTFNETYTKTVTNSDTGLDEVVEKTSTRVKNFLRPSDIKSTGDVEV